MTRDPVVTSKIMASVRNRDTGPELALRRELHRRGLRYRLRSDLPGHPDLVFPGARVAVFVDGDYWHGNTWRVRGAESFDAYFEARANSDFWRDKITRNIIRDRDVDLGLTQVGWAVIRIWESDLHRDLTSCADHVETTVRAARRMMAEAT
ncbi:MAG: very short patch repair endonuclease [Candidatus Dormibacteria bacterium]